MAFNQTLFYIKQTKKGMMNKNKPVYFSINLQSSKRQILRKQKFESIIKNNVERDSN